MRKIIDFDKKRKVSNKMNYRKGNFKVIIKV